MPVWLTLPLGPTNCYLLKLEKGFLLVDCGRARDKDRLEKALGRLGLSLSDLTCLFLTHHHSDHCGLLSVLTAENPALTVIMSEKCAKFLKAGRHFIPAAENYASPAMKILMKTYARLGGGMDSSFTPYTPRPNDLLVKNDDRTILPRLGLEAKIICTPGHTEDSISLVAGDTAFVGDAARNILYLAGMPHYPIVLYSKEECRQSWNKLLSAGVRSILPAHGGPFASARLRPALQAKD